MSYPVYYVEEGDTLPVFFDSFAGSTGASITMSGFLASDIEIYKDGSVTQRASDNGYTLLDTDGIDFDGITGIHGFSIDLSDNSDNGFYTVGSWYHVVVSTITIDTQTVSFIACAFRIVSATRGMAGTALPNAAADAAGGLPISDAGGLDLDAQRTDVAAILADTNELQADWANGGRLDNILDARASQTTADAIETDTQNIQSRLPAALVGGRMDSDMQAAAAGVITATVIATDAIDGDALAASAVTEIQSGLATSANQTTILNRLGSFTGSGFNTILGFLQAIMRSDATTPSDVGGTYDDATDSLQAIADSGGGGPTAAQIADAVWEEAIADHSGTAGSTAEALDNASAPTAAAVADAVWDEAIAGHLAAGSTGAVLNAAGGGLAPGPGAVEHTYTVTNSVTLQPVDGVEVWYTTDLAGNNVVWYGNTDAFGVARDASGNKPMLDPGTYYVWKQLAGYTIDQNPDTEVVA